MRAMSCDHFYPGARDSASVGDVKFAKLMALPSDVKQADVCNARTGRA